MKIVQYYSHLNGYEFLIVHKPHIWNDIKSTIEQIDSSAAYKKVSAEKTMKGRMLYSPKIFNELFKEKFTGRGWKENRTAYYVTEDLTITREVVGIRDSQTQKRAIEEKGGIAYGTYNQVDFLKERVAIEVQFGKYFAVQYDLHVKHTFFFGRGDIDVGVEIIPMHSLMSEMSSGVAWYENELMNIVREGRSNPSVPIVLIGIAP